MKTAKNKKTKQPLKNISNTFLNTYAENMEYIKKNLGLKKTNPPTDITSEPWTEQSMRVLNERYFLKDKDGRVIESVEDMCWRVAWELASAEILYGHDKDVVVDYARKYFRLMINRWFLPNSPTLMNAGKNNGLQYSACYVIPIEDSLSGIFDGVKYQGLIHQSGGGTGFSFSRLRPKGSRVRSTMGVASGPVSFMRIYNEATQQVKQGGTRRGANMGVLRVDHPDILEFIHCKDDGVGITNFNISVAITDSFMKALMEDKEYDLIFPAEDEEKKRKLVGTLQARHVWNEIINSAWKTGDPGLLFIDKINDSPANPIRLQGWRVESTNPCGEQPLYPFDACNLGSIFLKYFVQNGKIDWELLKEVVWLSVRFLDSVIDMNPFPLPQIAETVRNIRRIGLGVGGWADMLIDLGIPYDSPEALELADKLMKFIQTQGHKASEQLALERGVFPLWKHSIFANKKPMRNSTVTTIAPTGSIGILANASGGIEPLFAIAYQHIVKTENRNLTFINPKFEQVAHERGFYSESLMKKVVEKGTLEGVEGVPSDVKKTFVTAHEIEYISHVKMQAIFQKYTDNGVSKTINLPHSATVDDIKRAYKTAWEIGCRGITVFRDGCKSEQVLNMGISAENRAIKTNGAKSEIEPVIPRPMKVNGATYKIKTPMGHAFITVNQDQDNNPFEVFVTIGKAGSDVAAIAEALGRLISTILRISNHLGPRKLAKEIIEQLGGIGGSRSVGYGSEKIRSLPDAVARVMAIHFNLTQNQQVGQQVSQTSKTHEPTQSTLNEFIQEKIEMYTSKNDLCPGCGDTTLVFEEGCKKCYGCGYSEC